MHLKPKLILFILFMAIISFPIWGKDHVHVFTSKGIYETCEDLWFKCIAFDDSTMLISDRSHTAYVEIVDPTDSVVWKEKYRMSNGMCDGHVYVGENWKSGEYRMFVHTRNSLGREDTVFYPKRLLIVQNLPEVPDFLSAAKERVQYIDLSDTISSQKLKVTVTLDSTDYHTRSKVKATVRVADAEGNPLRAVLALSVADALYSYPLADVNIESQAYGILNDSLRIENREIKAFLSDGPVSGQLRSGRKKDPVTLDGQYINVFDESAEKGDVNIIAVGKDGYFDVSPEICSSLGKNLLIKPLVKDELKPKLEFDNPFKEIAEIRLRAEDRNYPIIRKGGIIENKDSFEYAGDYSGRHTVRLDEVVVKGRSKNYSRRKKDKLLNYLDSLAISKGQAWVCCGKIINGEYVDGFLNDYYPGYNHHPIDDPYYYNRPPRNISIPERGKLYRMIKMTWDERMQCYNYELESYAVYAGSHYSDEDLLEMEGMCKAEGYYPKRRFQFQSEDDLIYDMEDFRNTLVWLPRAQTDENGEFTISFYTSDIKSTFLISGLIITPDIRDSITFNDFFTVK